MEILSDKNLKKKKIDMFSPNDVHKKKKALSIGIVQKSILCSYDRIDTTHSIQIVITIMNNDYFKQSYFKSKEI